MSVGGGGISGGAGFDTNVLFELLASNDGAQAKISQYQKAKAELEKARLDLNIGNDVRRAMEEAQKTLEEAQKKRAAYKEEVEKELAAARKAHQEWLDSTKREAEVKLQEIQDKYSKAEAYIAQHASAFRDAAAAKAEAEAHLAKTRVEADGIKSKANVLADEADAAKKDYQSLKSKYDVALKKIKSAVAEI